MDSLGQRKRKRNTKPGCKENHEVKRRKKSKKDKKETKKEKESTKETKNERKERRKKKKKEKGQTIPNDENGCPSSEPSNQESIGAGDSSSLLLQREADQFIDPALLPWSNENPRPLAESSAIPTGVVLSDEERNDRCVTLLLFYQYVEPFWEEAEYEMALQRAESIAQSCHLTGRMRVAREGFNCTLSALQKDDMYDFCQALREWKPELFCRTEFKLTHDLPTQQAFRDLKIIPVVELVHYGLEGAKAPPIAKFHGTHLEPVDYHKKLAEPGTVVIDVRNHYEAIIGHFEPPRDENAEDAPKYIDPMMRKSTEFPVWLDNPETQNELKGKQVLMFCTGGIRCERATALLKFKMETDPVMKDLGIKGVYQLQGGIDKYFKEFPDGGYWKGKNYVFDKRFAHAPPAKEEFLAEKAPDIVKPDSPMTHCQNCRKPWDKYRGKRRCPTCGVPSLICKVCLDANPKISIRCDVCVAQDIRSRRDLKAKEMREIADYEARCKERGVLLAHEAAPRMENPDQITRLFLRNMCKKKMTDEVLLEAMPGITHLVWRTDRKTGDFLGQAWVEMESAERAASAVARSGLILLGRPLYITYQKSDPKDLWPPPASAVKR